MLFDQAQKDMRVAYVCGAPGVFISGLVWLFAGFVALQFGFQKSILVFFLGGMLIFPVSVLISKWFNNNQSPDAKNPLVKLGLESTFILFVGLFIAYTIAQSQAQWFYPIMLLTIGVRYFTFSTLYGLRVFWALGAVLIAMGVCFILLAPESLYGGAVLGGCTEVLFSIVLFSLRERN